MNPVSKVKVSWTAVDTASFAVNMSSNRLRAATAPHSFVCRALCAQSARGSLASSPYGK
nr:hypothetical protein [Streptomyces tauricus]